MQASAPKLNACMMFILLMPLLAAQFMAQNMKYHFAVKVSLSAPDTPDLGLLCTRDILHRHTA